MKVTVSAFGGISPRTPPRFLDATQAQTATNVATWDGPSLRPLLGFSAPVAALPKIAGGPVLTIYRWGQESRNEAQYWFHWNQDVDVARTQIPGDTTERTMFTGTDIPRVTDSALAVGGTNYPVASLALGLPAPTVAATMTVTGTAAGGSTPATGTLVWTWVNNWGEESAPSPASALFTYSSGQTVNATALPAVPSGAYNITNRRFYLAIAGSSSAEYLFIGQSTAAATSFAWNQATPPQEVLPSLNWDMPPADLKGLVAMPNGVNAGFRGIDVFLCEPYRPFAWPEAYVQTVDHAVVGLAAIDTTVVVLTVGPPYFIQGTHPDSMVLVKADLQQSCESKRSIVSMGGSVIYASPDGLVAASPGGSDIITKNLFNRSQWQALRPSSMHAYSHDGRYVCFYDTGTTQGGFVFDPAAGVFVMHDLWATAGYSDLLTDTLYLAVGGNVVKWLGGAARTYTWRSKRFSLPKPVSMTVARVQAESYPVTARFFSNGELICTKTVLNRRPFRLGTGRLSRDLEIELTGTNEVFQLDIAQGIVELTGV